MNMRADLRRSSSRIMQMRRQHMQTQQRSASTAAANSAGGTFGQSALRRRSAVCESRAVSGHSALLPHQPP